ncbi:YtpI family protein [Paenibacillus sp. YPG26]|uniref:YtpI family protein n=1 Tax=Paenibacillus sp. YPG26 TaxID=2878915 RepID=UPI00203E032B|nr:YtpI family protein [Paenibacillus sp. YPG26]USB32388.1 YtpI family protein [Paenibacillus sp. YPG26]
MIEVIEYILYAVLIVACVCSVYFSFRSRRSTEPNVRGLNAAKNNVSMGVMLIVLSVIQMFMFTGSTLRVVIGALFMVLGAFNIFAGLRNISAYTRRSS